MNTAKISEIESPAGGHQMNIRQTAENICLQTTMSMDAGQPLFILVYYRHEADKIALIRVLQRLLDEEDVTARTFDPVRFSDHGTGKLYTKMAAASKEGSLCLIAGLPLDDDAIRPDHEFLRYLNIHRDRIAQDCIRMVLFLRESHSQDFIDAAGDLWDFRNAILWVERSEQCICPA